MPFLTIFFFKKADCREYKPPETHDAVLVDFINMLSLLPVTPIHLLGCRDSANIALGSALAVPFGRYRPFLVTLDEANLYEAGR